ncbi:hypothetical protein PENSPDRAFT_691189 [Peniophora sp. CONT]|nr:hypothetical protein PENSPDRAFT_691189 [Peniophora sp. CONT]
MWTTECPLYRKASALPADPDDDSAIITALAFSPAGDLIAVASCGESASFLRVYATDSCLLVRISSLKSADATGLAHAVEATCLVWHPSAKAVIVGDDRGGVRSVSMVSAESEGPLLNWGGGEIRGFAIAGNLLAISSPEWASTSFMPTYQCGVWRDRIVMQFPEDANGSYVPDRSPVGMSFGSGSDILVVTYETEGIILYNARSGQAIHHIRSVDHPCGSSALSPSGNKLFAMNIHDGLDVFIIDGVNSRYETSMQFTRGSGVNMPVPIAFIHGGSAIMLGSTDARIQEIDYTYSTVTSRHLIAFGTADDNSTNQVEIYETEKRFSTIAQRARTLAKVLQGTLYVVTAALLLVCLVLGLLSLIQICTGRLSAQMLLDFRFVPWRWPVREPSPVRRRIKVPPTVRERWLV